MSNIDDAHAKSQEAHPSTVELLASLFDESKESKIRRVKEKRHLKSAASKKSVATRPMKKVQQRTPRNLRGRQMRHSDSETEAKAMKNKMQVRKPVVPGNIKVKNPGIKTRAQEKPNKIIVEKRSVPASRKKKINRISESRVVKKDRPVVLDGCVPPPVVISHPQRRSLFSSTTLNIVLPFIMGVLLTFLGTRLVPLYFFENDQGIALAKNEMIENLAPVKQDVATLTAPATIGDTAKQDNEIKTSEPPPVESEEGTIGEVIPETYDTPVSETPQETIITAKKEVSPAIPELSMSTHSDEAAKTKTFQRDDSTSYPYSVYLGSYKNINRAQEAISIFQKKGLSPYWVKVDLGEKGVWYRVLDGYFQTKDEVNAFIENNQITEGRSRYVLYANLIGLYSSDEELKEKNLSLVELGYSPYVIEGDDGESFLFTGAFYHKADAEKEHIELASKGIQSQLVKR